MLVWWMNPALPLHQCTLSSSFHLDQRAGPACGSGSRSRIPGNSSSPAHNSPGVHSSDNSLKTIHVPQVTQLGELRVFIPGAAELAWFEFSAPGSPRDQREFWSCVLWLRAAQESEHLQSEGIFSLLRSTEGWMERPQMSAENSPGIWSPSKCHWNGTEDVSNCYTMKTEGSSTCLLLPGLIDGDPTSPERGRMAGPVCHYWMG